MIRKLTFSLLCFMLTLSLFGVSFVSGSTLNDTPKTVKASAGANKNNKQKTEKKDTKTKKELSLAERICGKYSHYDKESEDFETLSFACFGDNLYAYAGRAFDEVEDSLTNYSIWAIEYIPEDAEDLKSTDADSVKVKALSFSNMSLLGRYQGDAVEGTIRLTKDGLVLEDFGSTGKTEYKKDDRVEDAFACLDKEPSAGYEKLQGYWCMKADYDPVYLFFYGSNMYIYRKLPGLEVTFYGGEYSVSGNELSVYLGSIESASEPFEGKTEFTIKKDILTFLDDCLDGIDMYFEGYEFERIDKEDIPVYTAEDVLMPYLDPDAGPEDLFVADADT
ncbi:MAG: hypothetical protein K6G22_15155, partial [Lachnospiraceae bacterium]|nr:hypothetical protein [Lachnospiraceae bacterium]